MKKTIFIFLVTLCVTFSSFAFDESELNLITVVNKSGYDIYYLFISPADSSDWGPEILGSEYVLEDDSMLSFYIHYPDECDDFDVYAIDEEDQSYAFWDYTICDDAEQTVTFTKKDMQDSSAGMEFITVNLWNALSSDIYYLFLSPSDSSMWGVDLLDEETILSPDEFHSVLVPVTESDVAYDFMCLDENNDMFQFTLTLNNSYEELDIDIESSDEVEN